MKHTTLVDFRKIGYNIITHLMLNLEKDDIYDVRSFLVGNEYVNSAYILAGNYNLMIECVFKDMKEYHDFKDLLSERFRILGMKELFVSDCILKEGFMAKVC